MNKRFWLTIFAIILAGCGLPQPNHLTLNTNYSSKTQQSNLKFTPATIEEMTTRAEKSLARGKLVTFEGSFDREQWSIAYGSNHNGYRLWDRDGHKIRVYNIYSEHVSDYPTNDFKDFNPEALKSLLAYGHFVKIEGEYIPGEYKTSHGGAYFLDPSINVYSIDGIPVSEYIKK